MMDLTDVRWLAAVALLAAGLAAAALWRFRRGPTPADSHDNAESTDLRARYEVLLGQLQELDAGGSNRTPEVVAEERRALEQVAAQLLLELEARNAVPLVAEGAAPSVTAAGSEAASRRAGRLGFLWATAGTAGAGLLAFSVAQAARTRTVDEVVTSPPKVVGHPDHVAPGTAPPGAEEVAARAALQRNPQDLELRLELARLRLDQQDYMAVWAETQEVLKRSTGHPRALTYQSQVRLAMGQPDVALAMLKEALAKDPGFMQAHVYLSYVYLRLGQTRDAQDTINEAKRRFPGEAATLDGGFAQMKAALANDVPMKAGEGNPHAELGTTPHPGDAPNPHAGLNPHGATGAPSGARPISAHPHQGVGDDVFLGKEELRLVLEPK
jgi:tetratricopeptide (TPR) repeat protein